MNGVNFWLVQSETIANTYFIFRKIDDKNCLEIKVVIRNNMMLPDKNLFSDEANYIRKNILNVGEKIIK